MRWMMTDPGPLSASRLNWTFGVVGAAIVLGVTGLAVDMFADVPGWIGQLSFWALLAAAIFTAVLVALAQQRAISLAQRLVREHNERNARG